MADIPKPNEKEDDPFLTEFMERAKERKRVDTDALIAMDKLNYQQWLLTHNPDDFDESNSLTGDAYYDYIEALKAERRALMQELQSPKKINELRSTLFDLEKQMVEEDPSIDAEIREAKRTITFMISETFDGSMGDDMLKFAEAEIVIQEKQIEDACLKRSKSPSDIWAQYPAARRNLLTEQQAVPERTQEIQSRVLEIEAKLPKYNTLDAIPKSGGQDGMTSSEWIWGITDWNNAVRRVEYFNQGDTDCLPPASAEPWQWEADDWDQWWEEVGHGPPEGLFNDPVEDLYHDIERLNDQVQWLKIELGRDRRMGEEYRGESEQRFATMNQTIIGYNAERFKPKNGWHPSMEENIEMLQNMGLEGHSVEVLFNKRDRHVQRDLMARWGVDIGFSTRIPFKVSNYSHMNCFYGQLETHPNTTVLLGINIDRRNKLHVKTALRPLHEAEKWQYLEHKHLPGGVGFSKYTKQDLLAAHRKIVDELYGKKGPEN